MMRRDKEFIGMLGAEQYSRICCRSGRQPPLNGSGNSLHHFSISRSHIMKMLSIDTARLASGSRFHHALGLWGKASNFQELVTSMSAAGA